MRMGAAQGAPRRRRGLWHVCSHARRRGDDIQVEGSIFAMRGLTAPCAPSLVSYVPAQLERVRATTRRLVGRMRTARAHAPMWSAGARTHARELWRYIEEKSEMWAVCHVAAPVSTRRTASAVRRRSASRRSLAEHCHSQSPAHTHYRTHILGLAHIHAIAHRASHSHSIIALSITHHPSSHSFSAPQAHCSLHHVRFTSCHAILAARPHTPAFPLPLLSATPAPASSPEPSPPHGTAHTCTHPYRRLHS